MARTKGKQDVRQLNLLTCRNIEHLVFLRHLENVGHPWMILYIFYDPANESTVSFLRTLVQSNSRQRSDGGCGSCRVKRRRE